MAAEDVLNTEESLYRIEWVRSSSFVVESFRLTSSLRRFPPIKSFRSNFSPRRISRSTTHHQGTTPSTRRTCIGRGWRVMR